MNPRLLDKIKHRPDLISVDTEQQYIATNVSWQAYGALLHCNNSECPYVTFSLNLAYPGRTRAVKDQMIEMSLHGSGIRDVARVLDLL